MLIGSHVSMSGKEMLLGSVSEALSYDSTAFMIYTGAPQNTRRKPISELKIEEAHKLLTKANINLENLIVHAPYLINLGNVENNEKFEFSIELLQSEMYRTKAIGAKYLVLHPGAFLKSEPGVAINKIIEGLNEAIENTETVVICVETMAGKGTECGRTFEELATIISGVKQQDRIGVCLDTCHIWDAGYDIKNDLEGVIDQFDQIIGLDKLKVLHINDSKNICGAQKDRHANIGDGEIGFEALYKIVHHPKFKAIAKILETPYIDGKAPYKEEIKKLRS